MRTIIFVFAVLVLYGFVHNCITGLPTEPTEQQVREQRWERERQENLRQFQENAQQGYWEASNRH
jgi:hypothetical protein